MNLSEELRSAGVLPTGAVSAWPKERNEKLMAINGFSNPHKTIVHEKKVKASIGKMASNLAKTAGQAITGGKISAEIRNERYDTCKECPYFIEDSKRCSECGCFMEAKTWINADPSTLCPKQKWSR